MVPPPPSDLTRYEIAHRGTLYFVGFGAGYFGVWHLAGGPPVATFPRDQAGWEAAWHAFRELEQRDVVPAWRRPTGGWIFLHLVIGLAIWFALLVVEIAVLDVAGRDIETMTDATGYGATVLLPASVAGWMLFVYLGSRRARWLCLIGLLGVGFALALATGFAGQPTA
jgi:hypothetical protein